MKAIVIHSFGSIEELKLEDVPIPKPGPDQVLVRVRAAGVGPWDALVRTGKSGLPQPLPLTPGSDIAGIVEGTGEEVFGVTNPSFTGGYAEYAIAANDSIAAKPPALDFVAAASAPVVTVTAWRMLFDRAKIERGQSVLIQGAAGNVGAYAVQLAHWAGARVVAVAAAGDAAYLRRLGAERTIDYHGQRFEDLVSNVDAVIDTVGGETQMRSFGVLRRGGAIVSSVSQPPADLAERYGVRADYFIVEVKRPQLERIAQLFEEGALEADVGTVLPLSDAPLAHEMLAGRIGHPRGKIVLDTGAAG
ncbi:MAG TPA: NADP-dependent oxidoreductase [Candidatus Cybelea sp.]|jgi:NADPH:quinone reductase-like Zn-dependent oxidoreductase|nr:NADP-dependent oxidoreductase [Candidatus Cybelea sp.]